MKNNSFSKSEKREALTEEAQVIEVQVIEIVAVVMVILNVEPKKAQNEEDVEKIKFFLYKIKLQNLIFWSFFVNNIKLISNKR